MQKLVGELYRYGSTGGPGACLTEAVSIFADEPFTSWPECLDTDLGWLCQGINDAILSDAERDTLIRYVPLLAGTMNDGRDHERNDKMVKWALARMEEYPAVKRAKDGLTYAALNDTVHAAAMYAARQSASEGDVGEQIGTFIRAFEQIGIPFSLETLTALLDELLVDTVPADWTEATPASAQRITPPVPA